MSDREKADRDALQKVTVSTEIHKITLDQIEARAEAFGITREECIARILRNYIKSIDPANVRKREERLSEIIAEMRDLVEGPVGT